MAGSRQTYCTVCRASRHKAQVLAAKLRWEARNPNKVKARDKLRRARRGPDALKADQLRINFGITLDDYVALETEQDGVCAICKRACPSGRRLAVDHNHTTGRIRGLLCCNCNRALGLFADNVPNLTRAMEYLQCQDS